MFNYDAFLLDELETSIALLLLAYAPELVYKYFIATEDSAFRPTENMAILGIMREAYV